MSYEFSSRWQLVAPMVTAAVPGVGTPLHLNLLYQSPAYDGKKRFRFVAAGIRDTQELAAAGVGGAVVLLTGRADRSETSQVTAAAAAGAAAVVIVRLPTTTARTVWRPAGTRLQVPAMVVANDEGQALIDRLRAGATTVDLTLTVASPYLYDIFHVERDRVPDRIVHTVTRQNTAQLTARYANPGGGDWTKEQRFGWRPSQTYAWNDAQRIVRTPHVREEWVSANDTLWQQHVASFYPWDEMSRWPARRTRRSVSAGPGCRHDLVRAAQPAGRAACPGQPGIDPAGRPAEAAGPGVRRLRRALPGQRVGRHHRGGAVEGRRAGPAVAGRAAHHRRRPGRRGVPAGAEHRPQPGRRMAVVDPYADQLDFRSHRPAGTAAEPLDLLQLDYDVPTDLEGYATSRLLQVVGISVRRQQGAANPRGMTVRVDASFDEGATWHPAPVVGHGTTVRAYVPTGGRSGSVSLRTTARDGQGNAVSQTVLKAYGLR